MQSAFFGRLVRHSTAENVLFDSKSCLETVTYPLPCVVIPHCTGPMIISFWRFKD